MSEEILKALMQLFAIIAKQDEGVVKTERDFVKIFLTKQLNDEAVNEYLSLFDKHAGLVKENDSNDEENEEKQERKLTSVKDSVKILGICKKINKTLTQEQKVIVLLRLFELVNADRNFTSQRMAIINTVSEVFKLTKKEYSEIKDFVIEYNVNALIQYKDILIINSQSKKDNVFGEAKHIESKELDGNIFILHIASVDLYFLKYTGSQTLFLNGLGLNNKSIYLFASSSTIKLPKGKPIYYSDIISHYLADSDSPKISYECKNINYYFPNGTPGVRDVSFAEEHGKLIGIMGVSGAGKTTLLNVLSGVTKPDEGTVLINGYNLHQEKEKTEGVIGVIPQDDLLIEELTVFQNLYYNAKLCFKEKNDKEIEQSVNKTLYNLGLLEHKHLKVGSIMNKMISGGQRKRLNIALELIREPSILFVDEPTSGLSSKDSENVMDLLRELSLKGKIVFVVIHQPSSEIYKMFDKMMILDIGGRLIFYGNPVESIMYFKRMDMQINSEVGECQTCGNVNPELIFNIIEARVVDEFGNYTNKRKTSPEKWIELYKENFLQNQISQIKEKPPKSLNIPNWFKQLRIYTTRDFLSKISNTQYVILNMMEAPVLGFILSYIIRYIADPLSDIYIFRENENIPIFVFMSLIVALFLGLTVSAEEIFKDRKILKRESFLNLSRSSYLSSKIIVLFLISSIQALLFVLIANNILEIKGMYFQYWLAMFSTACFANMLGLNISSGFNSAVTIYIIIPLVMIPMMVLSGAMFEFDKLNRTISNVGKVPLIAEFMPTKWTYEALMVFHFKNNAFQKHLFTVEQQISEADFKQVYLIPELKEKLNLTIHELNENGEIVSEKGKKAIILLRNEFSKDQLYNKTVQFDQLDKLKPETYSFETAMNILEHLEKLKQYYTDKFQKQSAIKDRIVMYMIENEVYQKLKDQHHNEKVEDLVKKAYERNKILESNDQFIQQADPIFKMPIVNHTLDIRSHFYAPYKHLAGYYFDTFYFNIVIVWLFTIFLYISLYYDWLKKMINLSSRWKKNES